MGLLGDNSHWVLFGCLLVSVVLTAIVGILGLVAGLSALAAPATDGFFLVRVVRAVAPYVIGLVILAVLDVAFLVGTAVATLRRTSMPKSERLARFAERVEREFPALDALGVSERIEPDREHRREKLKQRYVEGDIDEREFERRIQDLMDDSASEENRRRDADDGKSKRTDYEFE